MAYVINIYESTIANAEAYLSPEQVAGLRELQRQQQETVKAKLLLSGKDAPNPAPKN